MIIFFCLPHDCESEMNLFFDGNSANHVALFPNQYLGPVTYGLSCLR